MSALSGGSIIPSARKTTGTTVLLMADRRWGWRRMASASTTMQSISATASNSGDQRAAGTTEKPSTSSANTSERRSPWSDATIAMVPDARKNLFRAKGVDVRLAGTLAHRAGKFLSQIKFWRGNHALGRRAGGAFRCRISGVWRSPPLGPRGHTHHAKSRTHRPRPPAPCAPVEAGSWPSSWSSHSPGAPPPCAG